MADHDTVAIVGLGYVGLPLAVAFGAGRPTIGFDLNEEKLSAYRLGLDPSGEVSVEQLAAATHLELTSDPAALAKAAIIIVVVPTPIDSAKRPDLSPLESASRTVGQNMRPGAIVVFESTVYPGCTEEVCVPILAEESGLPWSGCEPSAGLASEGFFVGYSPERINPGDKTHRLETIVKVVSGDTPATLERLAALYESVVDAGVHRAASIKVAEAAKVIENTQRDLNIALMNELAMIFDRLGIDTLDVLESAGTKWNFLPFRPGLVGGHCIGVDPYYLTYKAESAGYHPQVVLAGRRINDGMGKFIAEKTVKYLAGKGHPITGSTITVLGLTFKENCPDLRNSRVPDIISELEAYGCVVQVSDPLADGTEALRQYSVKLCSLDAMAPAQALIVAVPHTDYVSMGVDTMREMLAPDGLIVDVKGIVDRGAAESCGLMVWRL
ncbi:nucleotide sugar dehydrogenase [Congregibacter variabilis]|uniref:Nucleotide sugar dehydrogenase n=1 Tax=Congregibacter variabilis TaxID=3081200 RepID=A0ABZ0I6C4_9GAMM|nr:nucleotide sugar dehydrogenase [Congregibacter sp. IMCC43200]